MEGLEQEVFFHYVYVFHKSFETSDFQGTHIFRKFVQEKEVYGEPRR